MLIISLLFSLKLKLYLQTVTMATTENRTMEQSNSTTASIYTNLGNPASLSGQTKMAPPDYTFQQVVNVYVMPLVVITGLISNLLVVLVMRDNTFRRLPLRIYFSVLALSDSMVLVLLGTKQMLRYGLKINLMQFPLACHMIDNIMGFFVAFSAWLIVCVAAERALVVSFPLKAKKISTITKSKLACAIVAVPLIPLSIVNLFLADYSAKVCTFYPQFKHFATVGRGLIVLIPFNLLPFVILCLCYVILIWKLITSSKDNVSSNSKYVERLTMTSLIICASFFILTSPTAIFILLSRLNGWKNKTPLGPRVASTSLFLVRLLNYSTNFFICLSTNINFRQAFFRMFRKGTVAPETSGGSQTNKTSTRK